MIRVIYDLNTAGFQHGIVEHAQKQMKALGIKVHAAQPQSLYDCWEFWIDKPDFPLPSYITESKWEEMPK